MKNNLKSKKGFTLIEILVVISIIGLLSSVILVGLGGFRSRGRDARRFSDLRQVQNALELYYSKNSAYPALSCISSSSRTCWDSLESVLIGAGIGVSRIANDPTSSQSYMYGSSGQSYTLGAKLQGQDPALNDDIDGFSNGIDCTGGSTDTVYCLSF